MDIQKALRRVVRTGEVQFGVRQAKRAIKKRTAQLIVVPVNTPDETVDELRGIGKVPIVAFEGSNMELGLVCGKPFSVGALTVIEAGDSDILDAVG
jgi:large subunit ribosomal protein L30e